MAPLVDIASKVYSSSSISDSSEDLSNSSFNDMLLGMFVTACSEQRRVSRRRSMSDMSIDITEKMLRDLKAMQLARMGNVNRDDDMNHPRRSSLESYDSHSYESDTTSCTPVSWSSGMQYYFSKEPSPVTPSKRRSSKGKLWINALSRKKKSHNDVYGFSEVEIKIAEAEKQRMRKRNWLEPQEIELPVSPMYKMIKKVRKSFTGTKPEVPLEF